MRTPDSGHLPRHGVSITRDACSHSDGHAVYHGFGATAWHHCIFHPGRVPTHFRGVIYFFEPWGLGLTVYTPPRETRIDTVLIVWPWLEPECGFHCSRKLSASPPSPSLRFSLTSNRYATPPSFVLSVSIALLSRKRTRNAFLHLRSRTSSVYSAW